MSFILTIEDSKKKSSRSKADLFEVLIAIELSKYYGLDIYGLMKEKEKLEAEISKFINGERRTTEQYNRVVLLTPILIKKINSELCAQYGKPVKIDWMGRRWQREATLSDVVIYFNAGEVMGISLKSTRQGKGTQKNIGYRKLKKLLGLDIDIELNEMWNNIRRDLTKINSKLKEVSMKSKSMIKSAKYKYPVIQRLGNMHGLPVQTIAVEKSTNLFNQLIREAKLVFIKEILGSTPDHRLLNVLVEGEIVKLYWNETLDDLISGDLLAQKSRDKSYIITANGKPIVRLQASFTNGIGLSAFCERAFLLADI
ncbi:MAG: hypothetical protein UW92_C0011G0003 [Candidatus Jorgensenbacteria bacterium GW2011_GWA2_45_13]|uniref:Restriction endonuclease n=1 Tax=Candidatus Jorgensenbacteria bacterium GW2011_GWA2_45_13 TaxID=1618662 RepID=A0A0G1L6B0_9BACT|nr:MAG: hypothetical protein UW92_C0011G0003 [Candidatus Jorgensenbacteria bacterium GW2011_GWA2_45_13]